MAFGTQSFYETFFRHNPFPREIQLMKPRPVRRTINSWGEFFALAYRRPDVYVSVFNLDDQDKKEYDVIYLDIDSDSLLVSLAKLRIVLERLEGYDKWVFYSGKKGFHVYVGLERVSLKNYRVAVTGWLKNKGILEYVDTRVIEPRRVARLPYSKHSRTGLYHCPLNVSGKWIYPSRAEDIVMCATNPPVIELPELRRLVPADEVRQFDKELKPVVSRVDHNIFKSEEDFPPCIKNLIDLLKQGVYLPHHARLLVAMFLVKIMPIEEAMKYFEKEPDFNPRVTRYQLEYVARRNLKVFNCRNIDAMGLCPMRFRECPFFPSINAFLPESKTDDAYKEQSE